MVTAKEVAKGTAGIVLGYGINIAELTKKYGITLEKDCIEMVGGIQNSLSEQFVGNEINIHIGDKSIQASAKIIEAGLEFDIKVMKSIKGAINS